VKSLHEKSQPVRSIPSILAPLKEHLATEGTIFVSAPNAKCLVSSVAGTWWSMFKQFDHVSIPSRQGLEQVGRRLGLKILRAWSTELAFETPLGFLVALRDRSAPGDSAEAAAADASPSGTSLKARAMRWVNEMDPRWEPTNQVMGLLGRAGTIKVTYQLPDRQGTD
jgi:hypothetical protein